MTCNLLRIRTSSMAVNTTALVITIPTVTLTNGQVFRLCVAQSLPSSAAVTQVYLYDGTTYIPVYEPSCMSGNYVRADQLRNVSSLLMVYGTDPIHVSVLSNLRESCYSVAYPTATTCESALSLGDSASDSASDSTSDSASDSASDSTSDSASVSITKTTSKVANSNK